MHIVDMIWGATTPLSPAIIEPPAELPMPVSPRWQPLLSLLC
jgi:hypothetical protein